MKSCKQVLLAAALLGAVSCSDRACLSGTLEDAPGREIVLKRLDVNHYTVLDTLRTDKEGKWSARLSVPSGNPEFLYLFYGEQKIASLLVSQGDRLSVSADTLGHYTVRGSVESERLKEVEDAFAAFLAEMTGILETSDAVEADLSKAYIAYRRDRLGYVIRNSHSLTCVPVLFQQVNEHLPIFNEPTDAILFQSISDSLKTVFPESVFVKALEKEALRRKGALEVQRRIREAGEVGFIDMELPSLSGDKVKLSEAEGKVVMLYFWSPTDEQKMFNLELQAIYSDFHPRGFEIYAVALEADKTAWARIVRRQNLSWINVCDTRGAASPILSTYRIGSLPTAYFIVNGQLDAEANVSDAASIRKYVSSHL